MLTWSFFALAVPTVTVFIHQLVYMDDPVYPTLMLKGYDESAPTTTAIWVASLSIQVRKKF